MLHKVIFSSIFKISLHWHFKEACNIADLVDATVKHPRLCGRQIYRDNNPANDTSEYFKVNVSIPFLDHLLQELSFQFSDKNSVVIKGLSLIPKLMIQQYASTSIGDKRSTIDEICRWKSSACSNPKN